jgi:hypothetical protein
LLRQLSHLHLDHVADCCALDKLAIPAGELGGVELARRTTSRPRLVVLRQ